MAPDQSPAPTPPAPQRRRWLLVLVVVALVVVLGCGVGAAVWPTWSLTGEVHKATSVSYPNGAAPAAALWRRHSFTTDIGLRDVQYEILFSSSEGALRSGYGHTVALDVTSGDPTDFTVEWASDGATIRYGSGHRVFVPARYFLGGR